MANYRFTNKSVLDLSEIWDYTKYRWSEDQADKYYYLIIDNCQELANNPKLGKKYESIIKNLFGFKTGRHIIFYRIITNNEIEITRVLHEQMDLKKRIIEK